MAVEIYKILNGMGPEYLSTLGGRADDLWYFIFVFQFYVYMYIVYSVHSHGLVGD